MQRLFPLFLTGKLETWYLGTRDENGHRDGHVHRVRWDHHPGICCLKSLHWRSCIRGTRLYQGATTKYSNCLHFHSYFQMCHRINPYGLCVLNVNYDLVMVHEDTRRLNCYQFIFVFGCILPFVRTPLCQNNFSCILTNVPLPG